MREIHESEEMQTFKKRREKNHQFQRFKLMMITCESMQLRK